MTIDETRRLMARAALSRDTETYNKLKYQLSLLESDAAPTGADSSIITLPMQPNNSDSIETPTSEGIPLPEIDPNELGVSMDSDLSASTESPLDYPESSKTAQGESESIKIDASALTSLQTSNPTEDTVVASEASILNGAANAADIDNIPLPENVLKSEGSVIQGARRICNHCGHEFKGEIPWSSYVDAEGDGPVPRCEFCQLGRIMTVVGQAPEPKCLHKCPKCSKTWTHGLGADTDGKLIPCKIYKVSEAICSVCERIRQEVIDEFLRVEMHRSELKLNGGVVPKDQVQVMLDEEQSCKSMTDEELEVHILDLDRQSAEILARNKGSRKARAARFEELDEREKQISRQEWKDIGELAGMNRIKKVREKKEKEQESKDEKGIQAGMLAFNMTREQAELWWLEKRKK